MNQLLYNIASGNCAMKLRRSEEKSTLLMLTSLACTTGLWCALYVSSVADISWSLVFHPFLPPFKIVIFSVSCFIFLLMPVRQINRRCVGLTLILFLLVRRSQLATFTTQPGWARVDSTGQSNISRSVASVVSLRASQTRYGREFAFINLKNR